MNKIRFSFAKFLALYFLIVLIELLFGFSPNFAQSPPQAISWQTVVRMPDGSLVQNQLVSVRFDLHQGSANGAVVYSETHADTSDEFGLLNLHLGAGLAVSGQFDTIDWGNGQFFTEVLVDPAGGSNYVSTGAQQMMSVPYALYAGSAGNLPTNGEPGQPFTWCKNGPTWGPCLSCHAFGGSSKDVGTSIIELTSGGYLLSGSSCSFGAGNCDAFLVKFNAAMDTVWTLYIGGSESEGGRKVVEDSDGNYVLVGNTRSYGVNSDVYLVKVSKTVNPLRRTGQQFSSGFIFAQFCGSSS